VIKMFSFSKVFLVVGKVSCDGARTNCIT